MAAAGRGSPVRAARCRRRRARAAGRRRRGDEIAGGGAAAAASPRPGEHRVAQRGIDRPGGETAGRQQLPAIRRRRCRRSDPGRCRRPAPAGSHTAGRRRAGAGCRPPGTCRPTGRAASAARRSVSARRSSSGRVGRAAAHEGPVEARRGSSSSARRVAVGTDRQRPGDPPVARGGVPRSAGPPAAPPGIAPDRVGGPVTPGRPAVGDHGQPVLVDPAPHDPIRQVDLGQVGQRPEQVLGGCRVGQDPLDLGPRRRLAAAAAPRWR